MFLKCCSVLSCSVMSDSLRPYGLQPARLLCPWNFPGKDTGVSCHFLLQGIFLTLGSNLHLVCLLHWQVDRRFTAVPPGKSNIEYYQGLNTQKINSNIRSDQISRSVVSNSLRPHGLQPTRLLSPCDFPGKSTGVGCHCLLQGIFPTQGSNLGLPHCRQMLLPSEQTGKPNNYMK